jgi:6-phosphogluconate dehydrogenase
VITEEKMQLMIAGLGRMGMNMARRLLRGGHQVVAWNRSPEKVAEIANEGARGAASLREGVSMLTPPRVVWLMLPAGEVTDSAIASLLPALAAGDIVIDGGNTFYRDDLRRKEGFEQRGIRYADVGVSGGIWGLENGYCLMVGGEKDTFDYIMPLLHTLAAEKAYLHCGGCGAGHFVKMVHNGIEYGLMSAYGEGFAILKASPYAEDLNLSSVAALWNRGSVVRSWLLELAETAFEQEQDLASIQGYVEDSGEGRWTVQQAVDAGVPAPVIAAAVFQRFRSRIGDSFSDKVLAALRNQFGGHAVAAADAKVETGDAGAGAVKPATPEK